MATLTFFPNDRKRSKKTGRIPIYVRIWHNEQKSEGRTDWSLLPEERSKWNKTLGRIDQRNSKANEYLNRIEDRFNEFKIFKVGVIGKYDSSSIRDHILGKQPKEQKLKVRSAKAYIDQYYSSNVESSSRYTSGTKKNYRKAIRHMHRFLKYSGCTSTPIFKVDTQLANRFANYLMNDIPAQNKKGMSEVSACGIVKKFRTIFDQAVDEGHLSDNPFKKVKLSYRSPEKPKLSLEQFKRFLHPSDINETEMKYVQLFVFMSLTGTAFLDCQSLTLDHLEQTPNGIKLKYKRNKTGHHSEQYIISEVIQLIEKFDKRPEVQTSKHLVPQVTNQHYNRALKVIGAKMNIPFNVTTHHGRHTYRALLDEADIVDPTVIKKLMGWSNINSMDGVYRQVTDSRLFKTKEQLQNFINTLNNSKL